MTGKPTRTKEEKASIVMELYLSSVKDVLSTIKIVYIIRGKSVEKRLFSGDERARNVMNKIDLMKVA